MPSRKQSSASRENRILDTLPKDEFERLAPHLTRVRLELGRKLFEVNVPIRHVYFPISGVVSMITVMQDGTRTEVATIGKEGMVGLPIFLGADSVPAEAFAQISGEAFELEVGAFRRAFTEGPALSAELRLYTQLLLNQMAQTVSCNRVHSVEQRCCRWLLLCHDRVGKDSFDLTQEFLAQMLGVRRATVSEVESKLKAAGLISYSRGVVTIENRKALERASCECYSVVSKEYDRLRP